MKVTYTRILARKILLAFLALIILLSISALFVRDSIISKLDNVSKISSNIENNRFGPEKVLLLLHKADNDFQQSLISNDSKLKTDYETELSLAFSQIDTLIQEKETDTTNLTSKERARIKYWYQQKLDLSDNLYALKHGFDSLIVAYNAPNGADNKNTTVLSANIHTGKNNIANSSDTIHKAMPKRGFFRRIKDAIRNKDSSGITEIRHEMNSKAINLATQKVMSESKTAYHKKLQQLQLQNTKQLNTQRQLITLNAYIITELGSIITDIKDIDYNMADEFKGMALRSYQESTALLNRLYLTALLLVLAFAILLIIFIIQLNRSEIQLRQEINSSVAIAQQKMDLLNHMSHEIRNPLTAIKGFLFIFGKSELSPKQAEMLESIKLSSDMMLRTLNDTLDAAKMENSELIIHSEPFNPDYILRMVIESMTFSATKKKLALNYNFSGNKDVMVTGDSFRLKQIVVNLLSNAIKYTHVGSVTVNAQLSGNDNRLQVDVTDTGTGISFEQQAGLFSKYYQTSSSKGQMGTGLGLFICRQLVKLQGGKIQVKSEPGVGTTFTFVIPYQKAEKNQAAKPANDPATLLNGKSILAVDDNELNLMFLKKLADKWNVIFHQAANGKEALNIITKNNISIVLTDLQMPVMDGKKLLSNIKKLDEPLNHIPVIVLSGTGSDEGKLVDMGFSGIINKPFEEEELIEKIVKVLT